MNLLNTTYSKQTSYYEGLNFLLRNSFIHLYLLIKYELSGPSSKKDGYSTFIKGGSNKDDLEKKIIRRIS